jgi:hypothetical protein
MFIISKDVSYGSWISEWDPWGLYYFGYKYFAGWLLCEHVMKYKTDLFPRRNMNRLLIAHLHYTSTFILYTVLRELIKINLTWYRIIWNFTSWQNIEKGVNFIIIFYNNANFLITLYFHPVMHVVFCLNLLYKPRNISVDRLLDQQSIICTFTGRYGEKALCFFLYAQR